MVAHVAPWLIAQRQRQGFLASITWVRASACTSVIPAVSYLFTGLAGCSVDPGISCDARKLARTLRVTKIYIYIVAEVGSESRRGLPGQLRMFANTICGQTSLVRVM